MKIIKPGDLNKLKEVKEFTCAKCGCIFEADNTEYEKLRDPSQRDIYPRFSIKCPCCKNLVYLKPDYWTDN